MAYLNNTEKHRDNFVGISWPAGIYFVVVFSSSCVGCWAII